MRLTGRRRQRALPKHRGRLAYEREHADWFWCKSHDQDCRPVIGRHMGAPQQRRGRW